MRWTWMCEGLVANRRPGAGIREKLHLGNISIRRDWGWAPEYVEAMWRMLQQDKPEDFVIATGESHSLEEFVEAAFSTVNLNWRDHVQLAPGLLRPTDLAAGRGHPAKAEKLLGWRAHNRMSEVVSLIVPAQAASGSPA